MIQTSRYNPWENVNRDIAQVGNAYSESEKRRLLEEQRLGLAAALAPRTREAEAVPPSEDYQPESYQAPSFSLSNAARQPMPAPQPPMMGAGEPQGSAFSLGSSTPQQGTPGQPARTEGVPWSERLSDGMNYMAGQGNLQGIADLGDVMDITDKIEDKQSIGVITKMMTAVGEMKKAGLGDPAIKVKLKELVGNLNRMGAKVDPNSIDQWDFSRQDIGLLDTGGGQKVAAVTQPDGTTKLMLIKPPNPTGRADDYWDRRLDLEEKRLAQSGERVAQGWNRLSPDEEYARTAARTEGGEIVKMKDNVINAEHSNINLDRAEAILKKDPNNTIGAVAEFKAFLGKLDPAFEEILNTGDRNAFRRLMTANIGTYKPLLGPQISNTDAALMSVWAGATERSPAAVAEGIRMMREINNSVIAGYSERRKSGEKAAPKAKPYLKTGIDNKLDKNKVHTVKSDADYNALPSGATFTGPDGVKRRKP